MFSKVWNKLFKKAAKLDEFLQSVLKKLTKTLHIGLI